MELGGKVGTGRLATGCAGAARSRSNRWTLVSVSAKVGRRDGATGCGVTGCGAYEPPAPTFSLGLGVGLGAILFNSPLTSPRPPNNWRMFSPIRA